jgi:hypothetical protein
LKEVLEKMTHIFGKKHTSPISAMNNLAIRFGDQGQLDEAARTIKEVLKEKKPILSKERSETRAAITNLV